MMTAPRAASVTGYLAAGRRRAAWARVCEAWPMDDAPELRDEPVGIGASGHRRESDSMGVIDVPADRYWGAQTQRSLLHFGDIGTDPMPLEVYHAFGHV